MSGRPIIGALAALVCSAGVAGAAALSLPGAATRDADRLREAASYRLPVGPWDGGAIAVIRAEGAVRQEAWRIPDTAESTMQLVDGLRAQLLAAGYEILFECETRGCGGFDFRFATEVIEEPAMHVDLGDFRFLSARRSADAQPDYVSLLVSRARETAFVQITRVGKAEAAPEVSVSSKAPDAAAPVVPGDIGSALEQAGRAVLDDLRFQTGSAALDGQAPSLAGLADWLRANPGRLVALVGHTDAEGALAGNVALSRKRAEAVRQALIRDFGIPAGQIAADGVGYLAPRASNLTDAGRAENRRVEVILTSTD
jgi:OOP family OmpA-OmpF porin